jgi:hypothetical protein
MSVVFVCECVLACARECAPSIECLRPTCMCAYYVGASGSVYANKDKDSIANKVNLYVYGDPECMSEELNDHHFLTRYTA